MRQNNNGKKFQANNNGCIRTCAENEILVPDFAGGFWQCLPDEPGSSSCVGEFNLSCDDVGNDFDDTYCANNLPADCDGALVINANCTEGYR